MAKRLRTPVRRFGGKGRMLTKFIPLLESIEHDKFIDVFGGGGSVIMAKHPVKFECFNDLDSAVADFFRVLSDEDLFAKFYRAVSPLGYSRELYYEYRSAWRDEADLIRRVTMWFYVARQCFSGEFGASWGSATNAARRGMTMTTSGWLSAIDMLPECHERIKRVQIENQCFRKIIERYDSPNCLMYFDPPYIASTRRGGGYEYEMEDKDHRELIELILGMDGASVVSGYNSDIYQKLDEAGWSRTDFEVACCAAGRTKATGLKGTGSTQKNQRRTESIWVSPNASIQRSHG